MDLSDPAMLTAVRSIGIQYAYAVLAIACALICASIDDSFCGFVDWINSRSRMRYDLCVDRILKAYDADSVK
jgi:hypothetical protein